MPFVAYIAALLVFLALDLIWLAVMGANYRAVLGPLAGGHIRWGAAWVVLHGALFGLFTYAAFDLLNLTVIHGWSAELALQDMIWGMIASAVAALFGWAMMRDRASRTRRR